MVPKGVVSGRPLQLLLIDEEGALYQAISPLFAKSAHRLDCLRNSRQAQSEIARRRPDLVIFDISSHSEEGLTTLQRLFANSKTRTIPVIVFSDRAELEYELVDAFDFLGKPLDRRRLYENVELVAAAEGLKEGQPYPSIDTADLALFHDFLIIHSGLHFDSRNVKILERGLMRRMRALNARDYRHYFTYLATYHETRDELKKLLALLTVGETYFFRYGAQFEALVEEVIPELIKRNRTSRTLRIWSAGCSSGEEAYTLALLLTEMFPQLRHWTVEILATDINKQALRKSRQGIYGSRALRLVPPHYLQRYFKQQQGPLQQVDARLRQKIKFFFLNLQTSPFPDAENGTQGIDVIFCRNVMIYFPLETNRTLVERFSRCLNPQGYLFLGHAESLLNISERFVRRQKESGFYYQLDVETPIRREPSSITPPRATSVSPSPQLPEEKPVAKESVTPPFASTLPSVPVAGIDDLLFQANTAFHRENFKTASHLYAIVLGKEPENIAALIGQGFIAANRGDSAAALTFCHKALATDDLATDAYILSGLIHEQQGEETSAIEAYRKALLLDMRMIIPHYNLSKLFWKTGRLLDARRELKNTVRLLEEYPDDLPIPHSGGLSRAVLLEICRDDASLYGGI